MLVTSCVESLWILGFEGLFLGHSRLFAFKMKLENWNRFEFSFPWPVGCLNGSLLFLVLGGFPDYSCPIFWGTEETGGLGEV